MLFVMKTTVGGAHPTADACFLKPFPGRGLGTLRRSGQKFVRVADFSLAYTEQLAYDVYATIDKTAFAT